MFDDVYLDGIKNVFIMSQYFSILMCHRLQSWLSVYTLDLFVSLGETECVLWSEFDKEKMQVLCRFV